MAGIMENGWLPIEEAPKDGTQILVSSERGVSVAAWNNERRGPGTSGYIQAPGWVVYADGNEVPDEGWDDGAGYTLEIKPTHWMHLPTPPKGEA